MTNYMNELIINEIRIFIQKELYIIYMNTLITHMKNKGGKVHELFRKFRNREKERPFVAR